MKLISIFVSVYYDSICTVKRQITQLMSFYLAVLHKALKKVDIIGRMQKNKYEAITGIFNLK